MTDEQLREAVARLYEDRCGVRDFWLADAVIALLRPVIRAQALEEAARVAQESVVQECCGNFDGDYGSLLECCGQPNVTPMYPEEIAAAIRALIKHD